MCFSEQQSLALAGVGAATVGLLVLRKRSHKYVLFAAYFTLMEVLQYFQYQVLDRCDSKWNQLLTWVAYVHVCLQPVVFNEFVFGQPQGRFIKPIISPQGDRVIHWAVRRLSLAASALLLLKGAPAFLQLTGLDAWAPLQAALGPRLAASLAAPASCCADNPELLCGPRLCSISGRHHLGWSVPQLAAGYVVPTAWAHTFLFFVPALVLGSAPQIALGTFAFLTGPLLTELVLGGDVDVRRYEWATVWCFFSVGQVLLLLLVDVCACKVALGRFMLPSRKEDDGPGTLFSNLLEGVADAAHAKHRVPSLAAKRASGKAAAVLAARPAASASEFSDSRVASAGGAADEQADATTVAPTPRRSTRLQKRAGAGAAQSL